MKYVKKENKTEFPIHAPMHAQTDRKNCKGKDRQTNGKTDRKTFKCTDRQTNGKKTDWQKDRQTEKFKCLGLKIMVDASGFNHTCMFIVDS